MGKDRGKRRGLRGEKGWQGGRKKGKKINSRKPQCGGEIRKSRGESPPKQKGKTTRRNRRGGHDRKRKRRELKRRTRVEHNFRSK